MDNIQFKQGENAARLGITVNLCLTVFKIAAGILGRSQAMVSDGFHSLSDIIAGTLVLGSLKIAKKPVDKSHPYGHGKAESIAAFVVSIILIFFAVIILYRACHTLIRGTSIVPGVLPLYAAVASIIIKELMFRYAKRIGERINSPAVMADAYDHRSDAFSSIAAFVGIGGARLGYPFLDPAAGFIVALCILRMGARICISSLGELMDHSLPEDYEEKIESLVLQFAEVEKIDQIKTRRIGRVNCIDLEIQVDSGMTVGESHSITHKIEGLLKSEMDNVGNVMIHINPAKMRP